METKPRGVCDSCVGQGMKTNTRRGNEPRARESIVWLLHGKSWDPNLETCLIAASGKSQWRTNIEGGNESETCQSSV